jgi:hypothetical protein
MAKFDISERLLEEGYICVAGRLESIDDPRHLSEETINAIVLNKGDLESLLKGKSKGARYIGRRLASDPTISVAKACSDWAALKDLRRWLEGQDKSWLRTMHLAWIDHNGDWKVEAGRLLHLGIRFAWQAERFCNLYSKVCNPDRPWGSCYQPPKGKVKAIALTKNYDRLPLWVKKQMVNSTVWIQEEGGRVGDIWRLKNCAKAWKWCSNLPKGIAERIGKLSPRMRFLADLAWNWTSPSLQYLEVSPSKKKALFWQNMQDLSKLPLGQILSTRDNWTAYEAQRIVEIYTGLPYGFIQTVFDVPKKGVIATTEVLEWIAQYASPADACHHLFGCQGKATTKAFSHCQNKDALRWVIALGIKNPDLLIKYFRLEECIAFQIEAVEFLQSLKPEVALRMVATTTFKIRGEVKPVEQYLVRDTGYLWNQIQEKPDLGRIRCWLTVHEELARRFVLEQPDEALPISPSYQPIQGLCAVDRSWEIELPDRTGTLKLWGEQLHNCVGGYGPKIRAGQCVVFAVRIHGVVKYAVEMVGNHCQQFLGERNCSAPDHLRVAVLDALKDAGI